MILSTWNIAKNLKVFLASTVVLFLIFFLFLTLSSNLYAHPGGTAGDGCHYCRTNCSSWGVTYGARHCHQNKGVPQPSEPIRSHRDGTTEIWEPYKIPEYSTPKLQDPYTAPNYERYNDNNIPDNNVEEDINVDSYYNTPTKPSYTLPQLQTLPTPQTS